jgi:hypothetical protein
MPRPSLRRFAAVLLLPLAPALAQQGYKNFENKHKGITFVYPASHDELPLPPTERLWVAKYVMRQQPDELKKVDERLFKAETPFLQVFRFELPGVVTPSGEPKAEGTAAEPAADEGPPVLTWEQFATLLGRLELRPDPKKPDHFTLHPRLRGRVPGRGKDAEANEFEGYLVRRIDGRRVVGVIGFSYQPGAKTLQSQVTRMAASIKEVAEEAAERADAEIDRLYASGKFQAVEWRKAARAKMAKGWKALDTENFLIVHHSKNAALIRRIARDIEAMRAFYAELFPPSKPMEAGRDRAGLPHEGRVPPVRRPAEHAAATGTRQRGARLLRLLVHDEEDGRARSACSAAKLTDDDSLLVLYHEALPPVHPLRGRRVRAARLVQRGLRRLLQRGCGRREHWQGAACRSEPWRIHLAKDMCEHGEGFLPLKEILQAERAVFYNPARIGFFYAGGVVVRALPEARQGGAGQPEVVSAARWLLRHRQGGVRQGDRRGRRRRPAAAGDGVDEGAPGGAEEGARRHRPAGPRGGLWQHVVAMKDPWPQLRKKRK